LLQSSKRGGDGFERQSFVVGSSANQGRFSTDLMNRSLPIRLELTGGVEDRPTPLGDLRHDYLPEHRLEIESELCGLIENWKKQKCPPDTSVRHPMRAWAQMIGGILKANGFDGFLSNWTLEKSTQDCLTEALGILAHALQTPKGTKFYRVEDIVKTAVAQGVIADLIGTKHAMNEEAMKRDLGVVLSGHRDETIHIEVEGEVEGEVEVKSYRIVRKRLRIDKLPSTAYTFEPVPGATARQK
jgi:hypothetical protein